MLTIEQYQNEFVAHLEVYATVKEPKNLYAPIQYILGLGGKRLRPVLTLMTTDIFNGDYKDALDAALAVEVFHNFTLIHDDIMDGAPLRRNQQTVHEKWDVNTGILSGDAMLIMSYQLFEVFGPNLFEDLTKLFSKTALEVCEGQQYDVDFETRNDVTIPEYLKMIELKTSVLLAAAMRMGAIIAGASKTNQEAIYEFGRNLGIAFQLQDDYLDAYGNPENFGKQVGGDIIENKKTYLYLKAYEFSAEEDRQELFELFSTHPNDPSSKIVRAKEIFRDSGSADATQEAIKYFTNKAFKVLNNLDISNEKKDLLLSFGNKLMKRSI